MKKGMFALEAFKGCLTQNVISVIHAINTDTVAMPGQMTTTTYSSE
jgi:hypothetical protein